MPGLRVHVFRRTLFRRRDAQDSGDGQGSRLHSRGRRRRAALPETVDEATVTIIPAADIIVTFPLLLTERGVVESVDLKARTFELKRKDGSLARISVGDGTLVENVYADIFHSESKKGIDGLKKGDKVRARVFPPRNGEESALLIDVFHL